MIRLTTRNEIRHQHLVENIPMKTVARNLRVDIKTVRRHVALPKDAPVRRSSRRGRALDAHREEIVGLIGQDQTISAKRIGRILEEQHGVKFNGRTIRRYVQSVRGATVLPEAFVHRTHPLGETMEIDSGESWALIAGRKTKFFFFVATLTLAELPPPRTPP